MILRFRLYGFIALALAMPAAGQTLSLEDAVRLGEVHSPRLAAQRSALAASSEQVGRAAELPDPKARFGIENLPVSGSDSFRWNRDPMTMRQIGLMQEFPNAAKREARNARAERNRDVEAASLAAQRAMVARDVALAWLEARYAESAREALEHLVRAFDLQVETLSAGLARGRQSAAEAFMARGAREQAGDRVLEQDRVIARARIALAALIGEEAKRPLGAAPDTARLSRPGGEMLARLAEHPELRVYGEREALAGAEVELARSSARPDWALEVGYGYRGPGFDNMLSVMVSVELPWQRERRQDRDIASRLAEREQARAMREQARRTHEAEVRAWLADFDTAQRLVERFDATHIPLARGRAAAALAAYQGGRGELPGVLEAQRAVAETELGRLRALAERAKAWASLSYLYPHGADR